MYIKKIPTLAQNEQMFIDPKIDIGLQKKRTPSLTLKTYA